MLRAKILSSHQNRTYEMQMILYMLLPQYCSQRKPLSMFIFKNTIISLEQKQEIIKDQHTLICSYKGELFIYSYMITKTKKNVLFINFI